MVVSMNTRKALGDRINTENTYALPVIKSSQQNPTMTGEGGTQTASRLVFKSFGSADAEPNEEHKVKAQVGP
jgi:hypothetical protein